MKRILAVLALVGTTLSCGDGRQCLREEFSHFNIVLINGVTYLIPAYVCVKYASESS